MTQINPENEHGNMSTVFRHVLSQFIKNIHTSVPGIVEAYSQGEKRLQVRPAIRLVKSDGTSLSRPPIIDVPVVWPSGGGLSLVFPLKIGETVLLCFSERGIGEFKKIFGESLPDMVGLFSETDAIAIAGFGGLSISPATSSGASLQDDEGDNYLFVQKGLVKIRSRSKVEIQANREVEITAPLTEVRGPAIIRGNVAIYGNVDVYGDDDGGLGRFTIRANTEVQGTLRNNGVNVGNTHRHGGVDRGGSTTNGPQ